MDEVAELRAFNRFYTRAIGVLDGGLHDTPWSLPEARVLHELAQHEELEVAELRRALALDAGHLSRLLARLESNGLVERVRSESDRRRQVARLTGAGRDAFALLDARAVEAAGALLAPLGDDERKALVGALRTVRAALGDEAVDGAASTAAAAAARPRAVVLREAEPGDLGWVVEAHGRLYAREYGWGAGFEALVARVCADFLTQQTPGRDRAWIAEVEGRRAGCILCVRKDDATAQLRLLLVEPFARGLSVGSRLVDACLRFAERAGYREIVLWTNHPLTGARRIYERAGFTLDAVEPHADWGVELEGQVWRRALSGGGAP